ncbi:putative pectinesterase/pectinesterase inhibitor 12 [Castanea sativa]|uniref:putative pectinesterase/pectinesterase inhibitor 12 n=1 Tax=Castanea sativa TaxID=21020 RepID=UPI003F64AA72
MRTLQLCTSVILMVTRIHYMSIPFDNSTESSRDSPDEHTGISIQNCSILSTNDLYSNSSSVKSYLGRPWRVYSRLIYLNSHIGSFINLAGWTQWSDDNDDQELKYLHYEEHDNGGPSSSTDDRVKWKGYHKMDVDATYNFTVLEFIKGDEWLDSTAFPYDHGV